MNERATPEVVIFVGVQGSGKSTLYRTRFARTHLHISKDLMPRSADKASRQRRQIAEALEQRQSIVVDNTHVRRIDRAEVIRQARGAGARVVACFFDAPLDACIRRNNARQGIARVPVAAIVGANKRLEPPGWDEGYDAILVARIVEGEDRIVVTEAPRPT